MTFCEAYPTIETARVEITQSGQNVYFGGKSVLENERIGKFYDCNNLMCYDGGVSIGEANGFCKLTDADVSEIHRIAEGMTQTAIAKRFDVSRRQIGRIIRGERRSHR